MNAALRDTIDEVQPTHADNKATDKVAEALGLTLPSKNARLALRAKMIIAAKNDGIVFEKKPPEQDRVKCHFAASHEDIVNSIRKLNITKVE